MNEKRYTVGLQSKTIFDMKTELYLFDNKIICEVLNAQNSLICEQQSTINKLKEAIKIAYEEKPFPRIEDIQAKFKELNDDN